MGHHLRFLWFLVVSSFSRHLILVRSEVTREFEISEGVPIGTSIGFIGEQMSGSAQPPPPYLIVPVPGSSVDSDLIIDQSNGEIRTRIQLDRETRDLYSLVAIPINGENIRVIIRVKDENDNTPTFPSEYMSVEFPENTPGDVKRTLQPARDKDLGIYNTQRYSISAGNVNNAFRLSSHRERDGVLYLDLQVNGFLDRETTPFYNLVIDAFDGGVPPKKGSMTVNVTLQDANDNSPIFNQSRYFATVPENATVGTKVLQVCATDTDAGRNGRVFYSINRRQTDKDSIFVIERNTGIITVNRPLDFESKEVHELVVVATDNGVQPLETTVFVSITVIDVNDNQPVISLIFLTDDATPKVSEGAQPGEFVARISVHDPDSKQEYSNVNVTLEGGGGHFGLSTRNGVVYLVIVSELLDRSIMPNYTLSVVATDWGSPPLNTSCTFNLNVVAIYDNENTPELTSDLYKFTIEENNKPGASVGRVTAVDTDVGENGSIRYSIQPPHHDNFQIDPTSGIITATTSLDREKQSLYEFQIIAYDQGIPQKQSEAAKIVVVVSDVNDNAPMIEPEDTLIVREDQPGGTEIYRIIATDPDNGLNATFTFALVNDGYSDSQDFTIDANTGIIRTRNALDHEKKPLYTLTVAVRDKGIPPLETVHDYRVQILNINDQRPMMPRSKFNFKLYENATIGHLVGIVTAADDDGGDHGRKITYMIIRGNTQDTFDIDKTSGALLVGKEIKYEITSHYLLQVKAMDNSDLSKSTSNIISVDIAIVDVNNNAPTFLHDDPLIFSVAENARVGSVIWNFTATDSDDGLNGIVHYSIAQQQPEEKFRINMLTGALYLQSPLDYETQSSYILIVVATDQALNPEERLNSSVTTHIRLQDVNDNSPKIYSPSKISVYEIEPSHAVLHTVIAADLDSQENGRITYNISSGNEAGYFVMNRDNGQISLRKPLDREEFDYFSLNVSASDQGVPPNFATQLLQVTLENVNNNPPQFAYRKYEARVQENLLIGTEVIKVTAFDRHQSPNNTLLYVIPEGMADGKFAIINPSSGSISVAGLIDREVQSEYVLTVYAHDGSYMSLFDTTTVTVFVDDENDNAPNFYDTCTDLHVPENSDLGVIHTFIAVDPDTGRNGEVTFSIAAGNVDNTFSVDLNTGKLSSRPLDRERHSQYQLLIVAQDQGLPVQRTSCNLTVFVNDGNDNTPIWILNEYSATISENVPIGTTVLTVEATDADVGINSVIKYSLNNESHWHFTIDNTTGAIVTAGALDREKIPDYTFEVAATDGGLYDSRSSKTLVHIKLTDVNDNAPTVVSQNPVQIEIPPFTKPGQKVAQVIATDLDEGINADITYSLQNPETKFRVNPQTGIVTPALNLSGERGRVFQLRVICSDGGTPSLSTTALVVVQVGEIALSNTLRFQESYYEDKIPENSPSGTELKQVTALRNDGRRQRILYSIVGGNEDNIFEIASSTGLISVKDSTDLDRERKSKYNLVVSAKTEGPMPLYAHTVVHVFVTDTNDKLPRFTQDSYIASVWEGNNKGTFVTQVTATDNDEGPNANLIYHIVDGNHDNAFIIEPPFSGIIKTNIVLDREIQDKYRLTIIATDEGSPQMTGTCVCQITVIDSNDNQPSAPHAVINVSESLPVGSLVTTMVANDVDTNPSLIYSFAEKGNPNSIFSIAKYSGRVTLAKPLDFETEKTHIVQIKVSDTVHTAFTSLTVNVIDANERPEFPLNIYHITIPDDTKPGSQVTQVTATDKDSNQNSLIKYSLRAPKDGKSKVSRDFWIDENTGIVYTNGTVPFQHENPFTQLTIIATDSGKPKKSSKTTLWIEVRPSESDLLRFSQQKYTATISEAVKPGTLIIKLNVEYDKKLSKNLHFHYSITSGNTKEYFTITSHSGEILVAKPLDREDKKSFKLQVTVDCVNIAKCSSTTDVIINISDIMDSPPKFNQSEYHASVRENREIGSTIMQIQATDTDYFHNDSVVYDITSGNDAKVFDLNSRTGVIVLKKALDYDQVSQYRFIVRAQDSKSGGRFWSLAVVEVDLEDVNDHFPRFSYPLYLEFVGENEPVGTTVFVARATDMDKGIYGKLNYSILDGDGKDKFHIDPTTGTVTTAVVFDYESKTSYYFTLRANDIGGQSSTVKVQIEIDSRDEFPPQFTRKAYKFIIPINASPGYVIGRVDAVDQDSGPDGIVIYQLRTSNDYFKVNRTNGAIVLQKSLDSDFNASVIVIASSGRPGSKSAASVADISVGAASDELEMASSTSVADWVVGLLVTSLLLLFLCCTIFVVLHLRHKKQSKKGKAETYNNSAFDTLEYAQSTMIANNSQPASIYGPQYSDLADLGGVNDRRRINNTVSELSDQSHSASSGRGSAEDGEEVEDEEIRMINEVAQQKLRDGIGIPDLAIHCDYDNMSQSSAKNTQEYLARLGIRPKLSDEHSHVHSSGPHDHGSNGRWTPTAGPDALDNINLFEDEGGGDGVDMDISTLIYSQIPDDDMNNESDMIDGSRVNSAHQTSMNNAHQSSMNGSLSSIIHSDEELSGSYSLFLGGSSNQIGFPAPPQYQPLAHVFSEIARLKDDMSTSSINSHHTPGNQSGGKEGHPFPNTRRVNASGGRSGLLPSLPVLPRSPISHDSFASGPMSPSFSPALSPLANPSPSMSGV